jgi:hypothetical protein
MKQIIVAVVAAFMSMAIAGAYAADDMKKSDTGATKSEKGMAKKEAKSKSDKGESKKKDDKSTGK